MISKISAFTFATLATFSCPAMSEPTSPPTHIVSVRPYLGSDLVFFTADSNVICDTNVFKLDIKKSLGQVTVATLLTAVSAKLKVKIEVANATGCTGWGTEIQSVTVLSE